MKQVVLLLALSLHSLIGEVSCRKICQEDVPSVQTSSGLLHGFTNSTTPHTAQFLGIPFAQPPLLDLRFQRPKPYYSNASRKATTFGPNCMQDPYNWAFKQYRNMSMGALLPSENDVYSEDCLYLNVYTPKERPSASLPVLIWIHGGGFAIGSGSVPYQLPDQWVERTQSHIVVTLNYRLKIFGFSNAASGTENLGLLDQRLAVEWVRNNVEAFGGDISRITLWGQSAGAYSVNLYALSYPEDPIVSSFISSSGGDTLPTKDHAHGNFSAVAAVVGCGNLDPQDEFSCVQKANATDLVHIVDSIQASFWPQQDEKTGFLNPYDRIREGKVAKLPWIIGVTRDEGEIKCWSDPGFQPRLDIGIPIYRYMYGGNFSNISPLPELGAAHSAELPLIFGTHYRFNSNSTSFEYTVSDTMQDLWLSFITNASVNPHIEGYTWPKHSSVDGDVALFGVGNSSVSTVPRAQVLNCTE